MNTDCVWFECVHITDADQNNPDEEHAIAYADVDGYSSDENEEGTVICRVWLLKESKGFIVNWHHNGYRTIEAVIECINQAKKDLEKYAEGAIGRVFNRAYSKYKLKWMIDNDISIKELLDKLQIGLNNGSKDIHDALADFEAGKVDYFHNQAIWSDEAGFRYQEWEDENYMRQLLSGTDYEIWYDNRKQEQPEVPTRFPTRF